MDRLAGPLLMTAVTPVPSATVIVLRDEPLEVLMLERHEKSSFVPSAWVFPGGVAEDEDYELAREIADGSVLATMRIAAARETFEEAGVWLGVPLRDASVSRTALLERKVTFRSLVEEAPLDLERLVWTSRWITPVGVPKRFDTYFFLIEVGRDVVATTESTEAVDLKWIAPAAALQEHSQKRMHMVFPTLRNLEAIADFRSAAALIESRREAVVEPVLPVLVNGRPTLP
jgi:8-oxo-dGTP pyrophosphatase MutT (NUDIX family)